MEGHWFAGRRRYPSDQPPFTDGRFYQRSSISGPGLFHDVLTVRLDGTGSGEQFARKLGSSQAVGYQLQDCFRAERLLGGSGAVCSTLCSISKPISAHRKGRPAATARTAALGRAVGAGQRSGQQGSLLQRRHNEQVGPRTRQSAPQHFLYGSGYPA